ncbi:TRAP transporter substrate-binding protein [Salinisphaera sp. T31B1]|uniref:TRAP transporter substrate-binding protein n=1 Tax=Salinisphaera sp. T31B1 TaxID=727963 RepID=UPI00333EA319
MNDLMSCLLTGGLGKRLAATAVGAALAIGVPTAAVAAQYNLKIGCIESPSGSNTRGWKTFEQYVEAASDGRIAIEILPSGQLGDTQQLLEGLQLGIHKMAQGDETITSAYKPMMAWFSPYLFRDELSMKRFFESDTFAELNDDMAKDMGVRALAVAPYGFYDFINKKRDIKTLEDMKGLKLRTLPNSQITIKTWDALDASATPVAWSEIYTSIRTGVIDGLGHTPSIMVDQKYYEVAKHVTLDQSMGVANMYLVNENFYESLPADLQAVLKQGAELAANVEFGIASYRNRVTALETLSDEGVKIYALPADERARFKKAAQDGVTPWLKKTSGDDNVEAVFDAVEQIESN